MEKIGTGFRYTGDKLIVKLSVVPKPNTILYTEDEREVGKLSDVIGPVKSPFGVVSTKTGEELVGKIIVAK